MARLAIVRPEIVSERRRLRLYSGPHWKIGKRYWRARSSFMNHVWFLNLWSGSSGKKISESLCLSFWSVVRSGGKQTLWTSNDGNGISVWILMVVSWQSKCSTLLEFTPILLITLQMVVWWLGFWWRQKAWIGIYRGKKRKREMRVLSIGSYWAVVVTIEGQCSHFALCFVWVT